jgi:transcription elongation factor/antiterminator RfaH
MKSVASASVTRYAPTRSPNRPSQAVEKVTDRDVAALVNLKANLGLTGNQRWFLAQTLARMEPQASVQLHRQGFRTYLPQYVRTIRHARQLRTVLAPLFPSYIFVILDLRRDRWLSVRSTVGVARLVGADDRPLPVPHGIVESLIAHAAEANVTLFGDGLQVGERVRIATGPFAEFIGTLERLDNSGRVRVLLNMMRGEVRISLQRSGVVPASRAIAP